MRAGLHTGEVERRGEDIGGIGVHIAARISALAGAGEILVSRTVRDLAVGSRLQFEDRLIEMKAGDCINIPAYERHRVEWTSQDQPTIWLAVFYAG